MSGILNKDSIIIGIVLGICVPIVFYALFLVADDWIESMKIATVNGIFMGFDNLYKPLAIVCNLIPFHYYSAKRMEKSMRGVMFPTFAYVIAWAVMFGKLLF